MQSPARTSRNRREVTDSRRSLAIDTLRNALRQERLSMEIALNMLLESRMFNLEETTYAKDAVATLERVDKQVREVYGPRRSEMRVAQLHVSARTLIDEIAVLRESAFWLLEPDGVLAMERAIKLQLRGYEDVRRLLRVMIAKDCVVSVPEDPPTLPEIPANRYLTFTHPEIRT